MLRTHRTGKGPGGCGGWGLGSRKRRGPGVPSPLVSEGRGPHPGAQQAPRVWVGGAFALHSSAVPPREPLPPASPVLPGHPPMPPGPTQPGWGSGGWYQLGSSAGSPVRVGQAIALCSSPTLPGESLPESPSHLPLLISPASGAQILSGLHFSSPLSPPVSCQFNVGFLPSPWGSESPTSSQQAL